MKYWQAIKLPSRKFKRLTGVKRQTFRLMVRLVKAQQKQKKKLGRPSRLIVEDQVLVTLQYWREYRTYFHISKDWKIAESTVCRIVKKVENRSAPPALRFPQRKDGASSPEAGN